MEVCGVSRCESVPLPAELAALVDLSTEIPPPPVGPYFEFRTGEGDRWFFVPASRALKPPIHGEGFNWFQVHPTAAESIEEGLRGLEPFPAPTLSQVLVGGREARDPSRYLRLFDRFPVVAPPEASRQRVWIVLRSESASPWSVSIPAPFPKRSGTWVDGFNLLEYSPASATLYRSGEFVHLPQDLAETIERDAGLADSSGASLLPWLLVGSLAAVLGACGVGLLYARRLRRIPR